MIPTSSASDSAGSTFDTISPSGMKMSYRVIEFDSDRSVKILLTDSKMFKKAILFLYPVLHLNKSALLRDLKFLKTALNENCAAEGI